jgi:hypothetical protein
LRGLAFDVLAESFVDECLVAGSPAGGVGLFEEVVEEVAALANRILGLKSET